MMDYSLMRLYRLVLSAGWEPYIEGIYYGMYVINFKPKGGCDVVPAQVCLRPKEYRAEWKWTQ